MPAASCSQSPSHWGNACPAVLCCGRAALPEATGMAGGTGSSGKGFGWAPRGPVSGQGIPTLLLALIYPTVTQLSAWNLFSVEEGWGGRGLCLA